MDKNRAVWVPDDFDAGDLIKIATYAIDNNISVISANAESVHLLWSWLENKSIDIYARESGTDVSILSLRAAALFKRGASGLQIVSSIKNLGNFVSDLLRVKGYVFFCKKLLIELELSEVDTFDWGEIFHCLNKIGANGLILRWTDGKNNHKQFIGQIYGMNDSFDESFLGNIYFKVSDFTDTYAVEIVTRLCEKIQPKLQGRIFFFN